MAWTTFRNYLGSPMHFLKMVIRRAQYRKFLVATPCASWSKWKLPQNEWEESDETIYAMAIGLIAHVIPCERGISTFSHAESSEGSGTSASGNSKGKGSARIRRQVRDY